MTGLYEALLVVPHENVLENQVAGVDGYIFVGYRKDSGASVPIGMILAGHI